MRMPSFTASILLALCIAAEATGALSPLVLEGQRYVRLDDMASFYGGHLVPTHTSERVILQSPLAELTFKPDSREVRIGHIIVWLHEPVIRGKGSWLLAEVDALTVIDPIMRPGEHLRKTGHRVVVLDPGHGALDSGAKSRRGIEEKRAALDIARRVRQHLASAGAVVYMTRENDRFVQLEERSRLAAGWGADLFVSIHLNAAANRDARGVETFVMAAEGQSSTVGGSKSPAAPGNRHNAGNAALGFQLQRSLIQQTRAVDRGLKRARFIVLRNAPCPAALIECGFLSHADEEKLLMTETYRDEVARGIARGIVNYVTLSRQAQHRAHP